VSQQPKQTIRALAHANTPQRHRISQVSKQREIRDAARRHVWISMTLEVRVMKNAQPASSQNFTTTRVKANRKVHLLHSIRNRQGHVTTGIQKSLAAIDARATRKIG
jgi:hypothetical protein